MNLTGIQTAARQTGSDWSLKSSSRPFAVTAVVFRIRILLKNVLPSTSPRLFPPSDVGLKRHGATVDTFGFEAKRQRRADNLGVELGGICGKDVEKTKATDLRI